MDSVALASRLLARLAAADRHLMVLCLSSGPHWGRLVAQLPDRSVAVSSREAAAALAWTTSLAALGDHVFIILRERDLSKHAALIQDKVAAPFHRVTLVVETAPDPSSDCARVARLVAPDESRRFTPADGGDFQRALQRSLETAAPTVIFLPGGRTWTCRADWSEPVPAPATAAARARRSVAVGLLRAERAGDVEHPVCAASIAREYRQIQQRRFSPYIEAWIESYRHVGHRDLYLWRWTAHAIDRITLSCVDPAWRAHVGETKFLAAMFNVLLDDVADRQHQPGLLGELMKLTRDGRPDRENIADDCGCAELTCRIWDELWRRIGAYPRCDEFTELLRYDLRQLCNTIEYSLLVHRKPALINPVEHDLYSPHGMMVACASTLDLMCSPSFSTDELGLLREAAWHAGCMARIGNLLTTWEREIADNDFSSGVFATAIGRGWIRPQDLSAANGARLGDAIQGHRLEQDFVERWSAHRACLCRLQGGFMTIDVAAYVDGLDALFRSEVASRGRK